MADEIPIDIRAALAERARIITWLRQRGLDLVEKAEKDRRLNEGQQGHARAENYALQNAASDIDRGEHAGAEVSVEKYRGLDTNFVLVHRSRFQNIADAEREQKRLALFKKAMEHAVAVLEPVTLRDKPITDLSPNDLDRIVVMLRKADWGDDR